MTTTQRVSQMRKIITISTIAVACLGISGCTSQVETEFERQNGFKRPNYFGTTNKHNFVPTEVKNPDYYTSDREIRLGRPVR